MLQNNKLISLTNFIILITVLGYIVQTNIENGSLWLGLNIYFFNNELYYQVLSSMFTHGGIEHLLMNMFVLWQFGNMIEENIGKIKFLIIYFIGGILTSVGTLIYMYYFNDWANVVGASGAISVLLGFFALRVPDMRKGMVVWVLLMSFAPLLIGLPIAWYSHIIGFIIGFLLGYIL
jgi:membrane associated rhomboid family serine protease